MLLTKSQMALIRAGDAFPGANVVKSKTDPLLMELATGQAQSQAKRRHQDHNGFQSRYERVRKELGLSAVEVCAESWPWEARDINLAAKSMFVAWKSTQGQVMEDGRLASHWSVVSVEHKLIGLDMALGRNGIWFATILAAD